MTLGERIKIILSERNIKQVDFAASLGISANYVNQLVNGKKSNISETLGKLIEETYGYSAEWVMNGEGDKSSTPSLSSVKFDFIQKIQKMSDEEVAALLAFANSLDTIKKVLALNRGRRPPDTPDKPINPETDLPANHS